MMKHIYPQTHDVGIGDLRFGSIASGDVDGLGHIGRLPTGAERRGRFV